MAKFGAAVVRKEPGGGALSTDPADPNVTQPSENDTHTSSVDDPAETIYGMPVDGTTITVQLWLWEPMVGKWFRMGTATACTSLDLTSLGALPRGAKAYFQITANTGVTQLLIGIGR